MPPPALDANPLITHMFPSVILVRSNTVFEYFVRALERRAPVYEPQPRAVGVGVGVALKIGQLAVEVQLYEKGGRIYLWTDSNEGLGFKTINSASVELIL